MRLILVAPLALLLGIAVMLAGCSEGQAKGPQTVPVRGKVVFTRGGDIKSLSNRQVRIEFQSVDQPGVRAAGLIGEDGSFTVATIVKDGGSEGAVPGTHRVRLDVEDDAPRLVAPQFLSFEKSGITVKVPSEGEPTVQVWRWR